MTDEVIYSGRELEAMDFAVNYHRWILAFFRPYLGKRIVEVGAGTGSFSEMLLAEAIDSLSVVEPSKAMHAQLAQRLAGSQAMQATTYHATFRQVAAHLKAAQAPDCVVYVNVLEHIEDDEGELAAVRTLLETRDRVCIFVPALSALYSRFDKRLGHFRRYRKSELEGKCRHAGFNIVASRYFDVLGILPWWLNFTLLGRQNLSPGSVRLYDRAVVPLARAMESAIAPPLGKNLILVAERAS